MRRERLIDPTGGLGDLDRKVLRLSRSDALLADPVRVLRVVRLACALGFDVLPETMQAMPDAGVLLPEVAAERVGTELQRLFESGNAARGWRLLDECGLLTVLFEPLEAGRALEQRPFHQYTVLEHQLVAAEWMDILLAAGPPAAPIASIIWAGLWGGPGWSDSPWGPVADHLRRHAAELRAATLLHDIGKPATITVEDDGRTRFFGHSEVGADIARSTLMRWRLPTVFVDRVSLLLTEHLRPGQVASPGHAPTPRALHRFQRSLGDATPDVCWLFLADSLATAGAETLLSRWPAYVSHVHRIVTWSPPAEAARARQAIDGHAVMAAAGIPPGPRVGALLEAATEALAAGEVRTTDEALALVRRLARAPDEDR